jgi:carbon catabolite-derepressing protein kinase
VPFKGNGIDQIRPSVLSGSYALPDDISTDARGLLKGMLEVDPKKRFTTTDILDHPWMKKIEKKFDIFSDEEK